MMAATAPTGAPESQPYKGSARRLVISLDIGTTYSGASYCILTPGEVPIIRRITKYPGQEHTTGTLKIPTVIYYDTGGIVKCVGAEAMSSEVQDQAEDEEWLRVEWFKLRMRPKSMPVKLLTTPLPPLPPNKSLVQVFADYMSYLVKCVDAFVQEAHPYLFWGELMKEATFIIAHPNGWEGAQQSKLRRATITAELVPDTQEGRSRVVFVSEGEASLHFCLRGGYVTSTEKGFIVADLGGGTLDVSAYKVTGTKPLRVEEVAAAKCDLEGSAFVTLRAQVYIALKLKGSKYGSAEQCKAIAEHFERTTKRIFRSVDDICFVPFGSALDSDPEYGVRSGKLKLTGAEMASFFEPSIEASVDSIKDLVEKSPVEIARVYLVGGFSASPYLTEQIRARLQVSGVSVSTPDGQLSKAVPDGALSFYIDHFVTARVSKMMYCTVGARKCIPFLVDHIARVESMYVEASGDLWINGALHSVLENGTSVSEETEFRETYQMVEKSKEEASKMTATLYAYQGPGEPHWIDEAREKGTLRKLFVHRADLSKIVKEEDGRENTKYWTCSYDLIMKFGGPELTIQAAWMEDGKEHREPAQIVYEGSEDSDEDDEGEWEGGSEIPAMDRLRLGP